MKTCREIEEEKMEILLRVNAAGRAANLARIAARYELESDEFETWQEKAEQIMGRK
jgi:hypothetical protein